MFFSLIPLLILVGLTMYFYRCNMSIYAVVIGLSSVYELFLVTYPFWYSVLISYKLEGTIFQATPEELVIVSVGHCVFIFMFVVGLFLRKRNYWKPPIDNITVSPQTKIFFKIIIIAGMIGFIREINDTLTMRSILHGGHIVYLANSTSILGIVRRLFKMITENLALPSAIVASMVIVDSAYPKNMRVMGMALLITLNILGIVGAIRGRLLWGLSLLMSFAILKKRKKIVAILVILSILSLPVLHLLGGSFRRAVHGNLLNAGAIERVLFLKNEIFMRLLGEGTPTEQRSLLEEINRRALGPRDSIILYELYDAGEGAGPMPLLSSIFYPVLRMICPEKGYPGSSDGTIYGTAMFIVMRKGFGLFENIGPYLPSAHAYWEGGWIWLILVGLCTGLFWNFVLNWYSKSSQSIKEIILFVFLGANLTDGLFTVIQPLPKLVLRLWSPILLLVLLSGFVKFMVNFRKKYIRHLRNGALGNRGIYEKG